MNPLAAAARLDRIATRLRGNVFRAVDEAAEDALQVALRQSSGPHSLNDLRRMGHPYAKRHRRPRLDPRIVNVQSGAFRAAWKRTRPRVQGDRLTATTFNTDVKARRFLKRGTKYMVPREPDVAAAEEVEPRFRLRVEQGIQRAWRA